MNPLFRQPWLQKGATTLYACQFDQRFSYCAYVPDCYDGEQPGNHPFVVLIHGTDRTAQKYRDGFKEFAEATGAIILAPLFPAGIIDPEELNAYKFIESHEIRYDEILLAMIKEFSGKYGVACDKFLLFGFSGGAQFVHRFYYLHPERLHGVSVASPGNVTLLDETRDWFVGTRGAAVRFGKEINEELLRKVPVQLVIGSEDNMVLKTGAENPFWLEGVDAAGSSRLERIRTLRDGMVEKGISVRYDEVQGVSHEGMKLFEPVQRFFGEVLSRLEAF
ncbi:hypothetical protein SAMN04487895_110121 [Paenibacillus sophorae]|uniref:Esterase PHB depolymerase n=1 Tax=Paenibacillus sophorae TaxID=1333845 RepID=A0A1H8RWG2_9BACL|nr:hypothetical protein [Paenibacillus sophorae]QWU16960.1 hypothetical protein KP014_07115 [Paenibacillus sophorae]SEO70263.1 hypothetical protein SAMN04487895_110121 [Paenibacillus sophorae]